MIRKEELNQFTKNELIDILLSNAIYPFIERHLNYLIEKKNEAKLSNIDKEIYQAQKEKEDYFKSMEEKYHSKDYREVISKMNLEERMIYVRLVGKYNEASDKYCSECDKISNNYEKRWKK